MRMKTFHEDEKVPYEDEKVSKGIKSILRMKMYLRDESTVWDENSKAKDDKASSKQPR